IACIPEREDIRDAFLSHDKLLVINLSSGSIVGTSSLRRAAQLKSSRDDITVNRARGNIDTRIREKECGEDDGILLEDVGLHTMGGGDSRVTEYFDAEKFIPAIAQGALGIEIRKNDHELDEMLQKVHSGDDALCTSAERTFLGRMDGSCQVPIGGYATLEDGELYLTGLIMSEDGEEKYLVKKSASDPYELGNLVADEMEKIGAKEIIDKINANL